MNVPDIQFHMVEVVRGQGDFSKNFLDEMKQYTNYTARSYYRK
jgi:hypothetical protein